MKTILNIAKYITAIAGAIGVIWGMFTMYDNIKDQNRDTQEMVVDVWNEQLLIQDELKNIHDTLKDVTDHMDQQDQHMKDMERAATFYIRNQKDLTEEAMEDALKAILKKNDPTVYTGNNCETITNIEMVNQYLNR